MGSSGLMCDIQSQQTSVEIEDERAQLLETPQEPTEKKATCSSAVMACFYIPAGFCFWSWPAMLNVVLGLAASASAINTAHWIGLVITSILLVLTLLALFFATRRRRQRNWGPFCLCLFAAPLVISNPIMNIIFDNDPSLDNATFDRYLNMMTWLGTCQMIAATIWNAGYHRKLTDCDCCRRLGVVSVWNSDLTCSKKSRRIQATTTGTRMKACIKTQYGSMNAGGMVHVGLGHFDRIYKHNFLPDSADTVLTYRVQVLMWCGPFESVTTAAYNTTSADTVGNIQKGPHPH